MENEKENKPATIAETSDNKKPTLSESKTGETVEAKKDVVKTDKENDAENEREKYKKEADERVKQFDLAEKEKKAQALRDYAEKRAGFFGKRLKTPKKIMKAITAAVVTVPVCLLDTALSPIRLLKGMFRIANPLTTISGFGDIGRYIRSTLKQTHRDLFNPVHKKKR